MSEYWKVIGGGSAGVSDDGIEGGMSGCYYEVEGVSKCVCRNGNMLREIGTSK